MATKTKSPTAKTKAKKKLVALSLESKLKQSSAALTRANQDGTVSVLDLNNDDVFFSIDGLAAEVWNEMDGKKSLEAILSKIAKKEKIEMRLLEKECMKFIGQLKEQNLLDESK
ncbi:MAG: PqqD family protein [Bdellovibrionales bacterium]|nr:PqqD family protein [Bdellovibrionales bacterium]